ncbi:MAG: hypothetical protein PVSMB6_14300 [Steroidobacteraceae bacterium]
MTDTGLLGLIHAEIDGELDARQRAELAQRLLAAPDARALRDDLRRLCAKLDAIGDTEPPGRLLPGIMAALPPSTAAAERSGWSAPRWRYAAVVTGVLGAGAVLFETLDGTRPATTEVVGTMAAHAPTTLDTVRLEKGPVAGQVSLYRDAGGPGLAFELSAPKLVDALIESGGHTLRVHGLGLRAGPGEPRVTVALPGFRVSGQAVTVTLLLDGRPVDNVTLRAPN